MSILILCFVFGLIPLFHALRIKLNPDKVRIMQKVKDEQRGTEYEERMQMYYLFNYLVTSVVWMITGLVGWLFGLELSYIMLAFGLVLGLMVIIAKRYLTGEVYVLHWVLFAVGIVALVVSHGFMIKNSKVEVLAQELSVEGGYWQKVHYSSIDSVQVMDELPRTKYCKDGHSYLGSKKGKFRLKGGSDARFYVLSKKTPFVELCTRNGSFFVNKRTPDETEQLIEELKFRIGEKFVN